MRPLYLTLFLVTSVVIGLIVAETEWRVPGPATHGMGPYTLPTTSTKTIGDSDSLICLPSASCCEQSDTCCATDLIETESESSREIGDSKGESPVAFQQGRGRGGQGRGRQGRGQSGQGRGGQGQGRGGQGRGPDEQFAADRNVFHALLENHDKITREITNLDNGVETLTQSDDPEIAKLIQTHVKQMYQRVEKSQPIHMRDPLFREIFQHTKSIELTMENTEKGIKVKETSDDPYVVKLIQEHAKVVSKFVENGSEEAHKNHDVPPRDR